MSPHSKTTNNSQSAIFVENLSVNYGDKKVVDNVSFSIDPGTVTAIVGPNGSGKTTLLKAVLGLLPIEGQVSILGAPLHKVRHSVGYVPQRFTFDRDFPIIVEEFLRLSLGRQCSAHRIVTSIKEVGLTPLVLERKIGSLSGGQLQRVLIAQALLHDPAVLFLDEPMAGIDMAGENAIHEVIEHLKDDHGTTILMVSHDIVAIACVADRVFCFNKKIICDGPPKKVLTDESLTGLFGSKHLLHHREHRR
ncbi:MAG: ABC transporter-like protein [Candidatus Uhrbacteria bacterium GW2011_GWE2_45_35]|uniref:ABC transporter-like protein n=2 Tax=Candidatus Uhriibacteriota TaxID=1752732 RepID=A0A0G1LI44_9BACT|nr:MAG: ABC transporter-like protein [Candidatus Uhrbacteria bacterium GW2011_GWF2_44_350]KKU06067.1 MAG: ABC transporter-like protein [Candidatus Uhrbacteria bacterium GW2011_GWE2_45_35]HBR81102.1 ABC transporter ATP-binding protein [Candidatus Uhrbacteria bacterium]HCU32138.1 ABC transporter ATP-binding protein [Candidatus Uhrbacteria bacterium]